MSLPTKISRRSRLFPLATLCLALLSHVSCAPELAQGEYVPEEFRRFAELEKADFAGAVSAYETDDPSARFYAIDGQRTRVEEFYTAVCGSTEVAAAILKAAAEYSVPPALAFALAHEESEYTPTAVNRNFDSVDRGLFQLNSKSFPKLTQDDFFDPATNARYGIAHLAFCLKSGGNEVAALAMYNAGLKRVSVGGTPRKTLDYIFRIAAYKANLEALFEAQVVAKTERQRAGGNVAAGVASRTGLD